MSDIYDTQTCRNCGSRRQGQRAFSPNGSFWEHDTMEGCLMAVKKTHEEMFQELENRIVALEAISMPIGQGLIEI